MPDDDQAPFFFWSLKTVGLCGPVFANPDLVVEPNTQETAINWLKGVGNFNHFGDTTENPSKRLILH